MTEEEIKLILSWFPDRKYNYFVETGTYKGDTTRAAARVFDHVYTMEIVEDLYINSKRQSDKEGYVNITYYHDDSCNVLGKICRDLDGSAMFLIDAHISGSDTSHNGKCVPLLDELDLIIKNCRYPSIFVVDDLRFFNTNLKPWDWEEISIDTILSKFAGKEVDVHFAYNDRYIISMK